MSRLTSFVLLLTSGFVVAQQPPGVLPAASPQFDVTSVKRSGSDKMAIGMSTYPGGRVVCTLCSARYLLMEAFQIQAWQVEGLPAWTDEKGGERYDIEGKPAEDSPASKLNPAMSKLPPNETQRQMLQAMLVDRFQLKCHWRSKDAQVYFLERGTRPLHLQNAKDRNAFPWAGFPGRESGSGLAGTDISMSQLAVRLSGYLHRPVIDKTGLPGSFDFEFKTGDEEAGADTTDAIAYSLKQLGLNLAAGEGSVKTLVVDHIERPTEN